MIFVSPDGSDMSPGRSPDAPARSLANVLKKASDDTENFAAGANCSYMLQSTLLLQGRNILVTRYGDGPDPVLVKNQGRPDPFRAEQMRRRRDRAPEVHHT